MKNQRSRLRWAHGAKRSARAILAPALLILAASNIRATELATNLFNATYGTESATVARRLSASFGTAATAHTLTSVTLLLANPSAGAAQLDLYSNGGLEPGTLLGTLASPAVYSSTLAAATFTSGGLSLSANTTYWLVLRPLSGEFAWGWTADNSGTGAGFQSSWGVSSDSGAAWHSIDIYPTQMTVNVAGPCTVLTWYRDLDGDGYGNLASTSTACSQPIGYVSSGTDCDDSDADRFPGLAETCDGKDNDCNLVIDDAVVPAGLPSLTVKRASGEAQLTWSAVSDATAYDVVAGDLTELASTGDFAELSNAFCLSNNLAATSLATTSASLPTGSAQWFLIRPVNCGGGGTFDSGSAFQNPRDAGIASGGYGCP